MKNMRTGGVGGWVGGGAQIKREGQNIFIHCLPKKTTSKVGINGKGALCCGYPPGG